MLVSCCLLLGVLMVFQQQHEGAGFVRDLLLQQACENTLKIIKRQ